MKGALEYYRAVGTSQHKSEGSTVIESESKPLRAPGHLLQVGCLCTGKKDMLIQPPARKTFDLPPALQGDVPHQLPMQRFLFSGKAEATGPVEVKRSIVDKPIELKDNRAENNQKSVTCFTTFLARGDDHKVKKEAVDDLVNYVKQKDLTGEDAQALHEVASFLHRYTKEMRIGDRSAESLLLQQSVAIISNYLLRLAKASGGAVDQKTLDESEQILSEYNAIQPLLFVGDNQVLRSIFKAAQNVG